VGLSTTGASHANFSGGTLKGTQNALVLEGITRVVLRKTAVTGFAVKGHLSTIEGGEFGVTETNTRHK
jgi:hypothetical protein